jgi:hypothetical protein
VLRRAARKRDHRFNNSVASGNLRRGHYFTCSCSFSLFRRPHLGKNRPPSGRTSFGPHYFVRRSPDGLIVVQERLNRDEYLAGGTYSFERAASSVLYEPHKVRVAPRRWWCCR